MNKRYQKRHSSKEADKAQRLLASSHILIAVVALIECLVLLAFTTYSWIETSSSLVIMNGPVSTTTTEHVNIDISDKLSYAINLDTTAGNADLTQFYSYVKDYRYGKASSPDGTTFYFPKRNNTNTNSLNFRVGDTTDFNTSYTYFDFEILNTIGSKNFFFSNSQDFSDIFLADDPTGYFTNKTYEDDGVQKSMLDAIRGAMRMSITDVSRTDGTNTYIYSLGGKSYPAQNGATGNTTTLVNSRDFADYMLGNAGGNYLFRSRKGSDSVKVSVRIWFEIRDPDFQKAFGINENPSASAFDTDDFRALPGVNITVKFAFGNADNNFMPFYFDDYTYSVKASNYGGNITQDNASNDSYRVWFHGFNPTVNDYVNYPMDIDPTITGRTRWSAADVPQTLTDFIQGKSVEVDRNGTTQNVTITAAQLTGCYFAYGTMTQSGEVYSENTVLNRWYLLDGPTSQTSEFIYNAYGVTYQGGTPTNSVNGAFGAGIWNDRSTVTPLTFRDMATATLAAGNAFNAGADNYQFVTAKAQTLQTQASPRYALFVNNLDYGNTYSSNFSDSVAKQTAPMFYDSTDGFFKAYVPTNWLDDGNNNTNEICYFNYSYNGAFTRSSNIVRWFARNPQQTGNSYIYTGIGYQDNHSTNTAENSNTYYDGVGTWSEVEKLDFSAELIDYQLAANDRYFIGIKGGFGKSSDANTLIYYSLVPDATRMIYSAYVPVGCGSSNNGYISFKSFTAANGSTVKGLWYADARSTETTYYPVSVATSTASDDYTKGYWKVAVLVDGTYENLIYDTLTDDSEGKLEYSFDGSNYTLLMDDGGSTDLQRIDTSRWYVNAEGESTVYWRWTPYYGDDETFDTSDDTCFVFVQDMDDGMYVMVTEAANTVSIASGTPTTPARSRALAESGFDFEALGMRGFGEDTDDDIASEDETEAETEDLIPDEDADLPEDTDLSNEAPSEDESYDDEVDEE